jgi:hypothetical protein
MSGSPTDRPPFVPCAAASDVPVFEENITAAAIDGARIGCGGIILP